MQAPGTCVETIAARSGPTQSNARPVGAGTASIVYYPADDRRRPAMNIVLSPETQKLLEERMRTGRFATPDEAVRAALQTLGEAEGDALEDLDAETRAAIE